MKTSDALICDTPVKYRHDRLQFGFTIVELLVVIVIIGILAAITLVSYIGIQQRATASVVQSDLNNASQQLKIFQVNNGVYPTANNCPTPATGEICLKASPNTTYQYVASNGTNPQTFALAAINSSQIYSVSQDGAVTLGGQNLLTGDTSITKSSANEFLQYADLAPIFDNYGIRQYTISFDIKSADTSVQSTMSVYQQNGSNSRYTFNITIPVTTSFVRRSITVTPSLSDNAITQSQLAFYGTYGTGNKPTVKNVKVELGNVATPWIQAP